MIKLKSQKLNVVYSSDIFQSAEDFFDAEGLHDDLMEQLSSCGVWSFGDTMFTLVGYEAFLSALRDFLEGSVWIDHTKVDKFLAQVNTVLTRKNAFVDLEN